MRKLRLKGLTSALLVFTILFPGTGLAASSTGPGSVKSDTGTSSSSGYVTVKGGVSGSSAINGVLTGTVTPLTENTVDNTDLDSCPSLAGIDPVTELVPMVHAQFRMPSGYLTDGFTTKTGAFTSSEDGIVGLKIRLEESIGDIYFRVYREGLGWGSWATNDEMTPFLGESNMVTALQIRIKGSMHNQYDFYYRVILNDGSVLGWAKDGETAGTIGTGRYIQGMQLALCPKGADAGLDTNDFFISENYEGVVQDETGKYSYSTWDGSLYTGWAYDTENNKYYFQKNQAVTGWKYLDGYKYYFDKYGRLQTDLESVVGIQESYEIRVNKTLNTMTVYAEDGDNGYIMPVKAILVTTGTDTPVGEFETFEKYRWKFMHDEIFCQYLLRFEKGFLLHSLIYDPEPDSYSLVASTYNYLGKNESDGCVRMTAGDAYWVYENCGLETSVVIYEDEDSPGPFDRPCIEEAIPFTQNYDPTDPVIDGEAAENKKAAEEALTEQRTGVEARPTEIASDYL